jgi:hypothetical protein
VTQDEGRFGRINAPRRCWAPPGERPVAPRQIVREAVYVYAAVCPQLGTMTALLLPYTNAQLMNVFLTQVAQDFAAYFVVMLLDRAPWHTAGTLLVPDNIRLLPQPAASPELNPTELRWRELRDKDLPNQAYETLSLVEDDLCTGLNRLAADPEGLRSLTGFAYLNIAL